MVTKNERGFYPRIPAIGGPLFMPFPKGHRREVTYVISAGSILRWEMLLRVQTRVHS